MKIEVIGGGPAGLYFSLLMKKADPSHQIKIYEQNQADDTFGFGVVFSAETLGHFRDYDPVSYCLLYTSPSPRDRTRSRMPSSA